MWVDTHEVSQLTHLDRAPSNLRWSPDGKWIAFTEAIPDETNLLPVKMPKLPKGAQLAKPAVIVDRLSWAARVWSHRQAVHACVRDRFIGRRVGSPDHERRLQPRRSGMVGRWKDHLRIRIRKPEAEYLRNDSEIYAIDVATLAVKTLTDGKGLTTVPGHRGWKTHRLRWLRRKGYTSISRACTDGFERRSQASMVRQSCQLATGLHWAGDNSGVYFTVSEAGSDNLYFAPVNAMREKPRAVTSGVQVLTGASFSDNGQVAAVRSSFKEPGSLVNRAEQSERVKKLVDVNADVLDGVKLADVEEMWFPSKDGWKIQGWLMKPANFEPGKNIRRLLERPRPP